MTPALYQQKRDELTRLLGDCAQTLDGLAVEHEVLRTPEIDGHREALKRIRARLCEDQFRIALISKFQGGKSTTFNALAGGLPISPMGDGAIRTSACLCRDWNVADPAGRGVTIIWRSDDELLLAVMDLLRDRFVSLAPDRFAGSDAGAIARDLKLDAPEDRELLQTAVTAEVGEYLKNKAQWTSDACDVAGGRVVLSGPDKVNILFIAAVISRYRGHPAIVAIKAQSFTAEEVGVLLRFPSRFAERMSDFLEEGEPFPVGELAFAFIKEAQVRLESRDLSRLGAAIIDCPGLSASAYDSRIALEVIGESDAVWYLLDGKAIGAAELDDLTRAHKAAAGKLFFTVNMKADVNPARRNIVEKIIPHQKAQLQSQGLDVVLNPYHALLAYLAVTGPALLDGTAAGATRKVLEGKAKDMDITANTAEEAWAMLAEDMLARLKVPERQAFVALQDKVSPDGIALVRKASELDSILAQVEGYVVANKAAAVLVDGGVSRAVQAVEDGIEKPLQAREEDAARSHDECSQRYSKMEARLKAFHEASALILLTLADTATDRRLAEDFIDQVIMKSIPDAAAIAAPRIRKEIGYRSALWDMLVRKLGGTREGDGKTKAEREVERLLWTALGESSAASAQEWGEKLKTGRNPYLQSFLALVDRCRQHVQADWSSAMVEVPDLKQLPLPTVVFGDTGGVASLTPANLQTQLDTIAGHPMASDVIKVMVGALGGWALFGLIALQFEPIGLVFTVVCAVVCAVLAKFVKTEDRLRARIRDAVEDALDKGFRANRVGLVDSLAAGKMAELRKPYIECFEEGFRIQAKELDEQRRRAEADQRATADGRRLIARECQHIRKEHVEPLRRKLEAYRSAVLPLVLREVMPQ
jgi:hypothetical protein